jgi:phosphatidyl-myo-inositol dimannoside synthase
MSRGPRILLVAGEVFARGGIQRFNRTLVQSLGELDCALTVATLNDAQADPALAGQCTTRCFGRNRLAFATYIVRSVMTGAFDVVLVGHVHYALLVRLAGLLRPASGPALVLIAHGLEVWTGISGMRRWAVRGMRSILCVSGYTRQMLLQQAPELGTERLVIFPNALAPDWVKQAAPAPNEAGGSGSARPPYLLSVTRLDSRERLKGIVTSLEAFASLQAPLRYVIAGDGNDRAFLARAAERLGVGDRVDFAGAVPDAGLRNLYVGCAAFVLPSAQEGFGIVFLEAMYFGAPVIAAAEKGAVDVVEHERTGLLIPYGDVVGLRAAMLRLLEDAPLRERIRLQASAMVTSGGNFTYEAFVQRVAREFALRPRAG